MHESRMRPPILTSDIFAYNLCNIIKFIYMYDQYLNKTLEKLQWHSINTF